MTLYRTAATVASNVEKGEGLRAQLFGSNIVEKNVLPQVSFLANNALQQKSNLDTLIEQTGLNKVVGKKDLWLARVLITELVFGRKSFHAQCPISKAVYKMKSKLKNKAAEMGLQKKPETLIPRYVRIDTRKVTIEDTHNYLRTNGYKHINALVDSKTKLDGKAYGLDGHIPGLLAFHAKAPVHSLDWVTSGRLILQDKSSCLVAHLLAPHPSATVLDMCAAPGFKTLHVSSLTHDLGHIVAVEVDEKRFEALTNMKEMYNVRSLHCINGDVLDDTHLEPFKNSVEYILLDPPCSGTGMVKNYDYDAEPKQNSKRFGKLHNLQVQMLRKALTDFPAVRRVTYSTCSTSEEENEAVIDELLSDLPGKFKLVDLTPFFPGLSRGRSLYSSGSKCIRLSPEVDKTNGFFIAMFERINPLITPEPYPTIGNDLKRRADDSELLKPKKKKAKKEHKVLQSNEEEMEDDPPEEADEDEKADTSSSEEAENVDAEEDSKEEDSSDSAENGDLGMEEEDANEDGEENDSDEDEDEENDSEEDEEEEKESGKAHGRGNSPQKRGGHREFWSQGHGRFNGRGRGFNRGGGRYNNSRGDRGFSPRGYRGSNRGDRGSNRGGRGFSPRGHRGGGDFHRGGRGFNRGGRGFNRGDRRGGRGRGFHRNSDGPKA